MKKTDLLAELPTWKLEELWDMFNTAYQDTHAIPEEEWNKVKHGTKLKINIQDFIRYYNSERTYFIVSPRTRKVYNLGQPCTIQQFDDEIDTRKAIMRVHLMNYLEEDKGQTMSRTTIDT